MVFHEMCSDTMLIGGKPADNMVRIATDQIARKLSPKQFHRWINIVNDAIEPRV